MCISWEKVKFPVSGNCEFPQAALCGSGNYFFSRVPVHEQQHNSISAVSLTRTPLGIR